MQLKMHLRCGVCVVLWQMWFCLHLLMSLVIPPVQALATRRTLVTSRPQECSSAKVEVRVEEDTWLVSPGHRVPGGIADGAQNVCSWALQAPPGHGIVLEVVRMRLRRSPRCADTSLQVRSTMGKSSYKPLARFCGRGPSSKFWKTPFSMVNLVYQSQNNKTVDNKLSNEIVKSKDWQRDTKNSPHSLASLKETLKRNKSKYNQAVASTSKEARRQRVQMLQRFYENKRKSEVSKKPSGSRYSFHYKPSHSNTDNRRYYRDSNLTRDEALFDKDMQFDNSSHGVDNDQFVYDEEADIYAIISHYSDSTSLKFLNVGDPTWISNSYFIDNLNLNKTFSNDFSESSKKKGKKNKKNKKKSKSSKKNKKSRKEKVETLEDDTMNTDINQEILMSEEEYERVVRSVQRRAQHSSRGRRGSRYHRNRYYTVSRSRPTNSNKQYRVTISRHRNTDKPLTPVARHRYPEKPLPSASQQKDSLSTRYHSAPRREYVKNDIIEKPTKYNGYPPYSSSKNFGYKNSKEEHLRKDISKSKPSSKRKELFVLKARAYKSQCGGEQTLQKGRITSLHYPEKLRGKTSCFWKIQTKASSRWKLRCPEFRLRKSSGCKRDHLAIRINDGQWTRYCGREGPSVALTSSHEAYVEVVLNTYSKHPVKMLCTWTTHNIDRSRGKYSYNYWSYNLTKVTTQAPTTTTTSTTQKPIVVTHLSACQAYSQLSPNHTMCKPSPPTCSMYQVGLSSEEQKLILDDHNKYRAQVARGEETLGLPGPQYSAANMRQLVWNTELAHVAQAWATTCPDYHDCHDCRKILSRKYYVGQNIFYEWSSSNPGSVWETAIRLWYEEVKYVPNYLTKSFRMMDHAVIGHYTQLVWATTHEVGCGAAYHRCSKVFKGKKWDLNCKIYVCNYGPTGNYLEKPMYEIGPPASACPSETRPSTQHPGLCVS